jgi:hypothetical protein
MRIVSEIKNKILGIDIKKLLKCMISTQIIASVLVVPILSTIIIDILQLNVLSLLWFILLISINLTLKHIWELYWFYPNRKLDKLVNINTIRIMQII